MADVEAMSEEMLLQVSNEDLASMELSVCSNSSRDPTFWRSVVRHERRIAVLMDTILQTDIMLPKLLVCGFETVSAFHLSALRGADPMLAFFLDNLQMPADMPLSSSGSTALHFSCFSGQLQTVQMLVQKYHSNVDRRDNYGWSALHYASSGGYLEVVEYLVEKGHARVDARDQDGTTPAFRAENFGHIDIVSYFVQNQTDGHLLLLARPDLGQPTGIADIYSNAKSPKYDNPNINNNDIYTSKIQYTYNYNEDDDNPYLIDIKQKMNSSNQSNSATSNFNQSAKNGSRLEQSELKRSDCNKSEHEAVRREESKKYLQKIISDELTSVLSANTYLIPDQQQFTMPEKLDSLGFSTLRQILREEFLKRCPVTPSSSSSVTTTSPPPIYESIRPHSRWATAGATLRSQRGAAPALPPLRRPTLANDQDAIRLFNKPEQDGAVAKATVVLDVLESDRVILDAVFKELGVLVGGRKVGRQAAWKKLAMELPLRRKASSLQSRVNNIDKRFKEEEESKKCEAMLADWRQHFGSSADLPALAGALQRCGLAEYIRSIADTRDNVRAGISTI